MNEEWVRRIAMTEKSHDPDLVRRVPGILQLMDGSPVSSVGTALHSIL